MTTGTEAASGALLRSLVERTVFTPVRQGSAVAETVSRLGQAIGMGLLRPGDRLPPEAELADDLGISPVTLRSALTILRSAGETLDLGEPVVLMLLGILNFVLDDGEARAIARRLLEPLAPGSFLVLTHPTTEPALGGELQLEAMEFWNTHAKPPVTARGAAEIARYFDGLTLLDPGLVSCSLWRPDPGEEPVVVPQLGAVARKP